MMTKIAILSDTHGHILPDLEPGDLLICAGDYTACNKKEQYFEFFDWIERQPFRKKIVVAGNHDLMMEAEDFKGPDGKEFDYLNESETTFKNLRIWGSPLSAWFKGINPACTAFTRSEEELEASYAKIPNDIDIIISHGPAYLIHDLTVRKKFVGSPSLLGALDRIKPKLMVTAHIHENRGKFLYKHMGPNTWCINASIMNERYEPIYQPITIEL